jgi:cell division protein YceG involved in septum cleavage
MGPGEPGYEELISLLRGKFTELEQVIRLTLNEEPDNNQYLLMLSLLEQLGGEVGEMEEVASKISEILNRLNRLKKLQNE